MSNECETIESALQFFWDGYIPTIENIWTSLDVAKSLGVDISQAPAGSICRMGIEGTTFHVLGEDGFPQ